MPKFLIFLSLTLCFFASCKKDEPSPITESLSSSKINFGLDTLKSTWTRYPIADDNVNSVKIFEEDNRLFVLHSNSLDEINVSHTLVNSQKITTTQLIQSSNNEPFMNKRFIIFNGQYIQSTLEILYRKDFSIRTKIDLSEFFPESYYPLFFTYTGVSCVINNKDEAIIPVIYYINNVSTTQILILQLSVEGDKLKYKLKKKIDMPFTNYPYTIRKMFMKEPQDENIYLITKQLVRFNLANSELEPILDFYGNDIVETKDTTWYLGFNYDPDRTLHIFFNPKGTNNFVESNATVNVSAAAFRWFNIANKLVMVNNRGFMYHVIFDFKTGKIDFKQIRTGNITLVNDVKEFNGRVYIAAYSGFFYKSVDTFFEYL
jgi:hypothetical protein